MSLRHVLDIDDMGPEGLKEVLELARLQEWPRVLEGQGAALYFEKPSARTRNSTELALVQLGAHPITMGADEVQVGRRETVEDFARTMGCYHRVLAARVYRHQDLSSMVAAIEGESMACSVLNLLSDLAHPCQTVADLLTLQDHCGRLDGLEIVFVGDASNNVCRSLALAAAYSNMAMSTLSPEGHGLGTDVKDKIDQLRGRLREYFTNGSPSDQDVIAEATSGVNAIYTDVWTSMGQEEESSHRRAKFRGLTVDDAMLKRAPDAIVLHCLPAHRGEEISESVIEGPASRVWAQARHRLDAARGVLLWMLQDR
jgi:ornithine carbamoyltransferase